MPLEIVIIMALAQGLTEFIPVSSSAHQYIIPILTNYQTNNLTELILFLHLGTLFSLLIYYRKYLIKLLKTTWKILRRQNLKHAEEREKFVIRNLIIATIPAALLGFLLSNIIDSFYTNAQSDPKNAIPVIILPMMILGVVFLLEPYIFKNNKTKLNELSVVKSAGIGFAQVLAFIRGTSRSGVTLIAGQALGLSREAAAEFSFLMSIPVIAGSSIYGTIKLFSSVQLTYDQAGVYLIGFLVSFISGYFAIDFLLKFIRKYSLQIFGLYRVLLGIALLYLVFR